MPKIDMNLLKEEVPTTKKSTVVHETNPVKHQYLYMILLKRKKRKVRNKLE